MEIFEAPAFTRNLTVYLEDEEYRHLQAFLVEDPEAGAMIPETGGFRKIRWKDPRRGKGKRGGLRLIYYYFSEAAQLWFVTLYDKDQKDDLSPEEKKTLREAIAVERAARGTKTKRKS